MSDDVRVEMAVPDELVERIAERAAAIVVERSRQLAEPESEFMTPAEAAAFIRAKPQRIYDLLSDGRLTRQRDGARVLVERAELVAYLRSNSRSRPVK